MEKARADVEEDYSWKLYMQVPNDLKFLLSYFHFFLQTYPG